MYFFRYLVMTLKMIDTKSFNPNKKFLALFKLSTPGNSSIASIFLDIMSLVSIFSPKFSFRGEKKGAIKKRRDKN